MPKLTKAPSCRKRQRENGVVVSRVPSADYSLGAKGNIFFCLKRVVKRNHVLSHGYDNALNTPEVERQTTVFSGDKK